MQNLRPAKFKRRAASRLTSFLLLLLLSIVIGCGGGDDFSKPPPQLLNRPKSKTKANATASNTTANTKQKSSVATEKPAAGSPNKNADQVAETTPTKTDSNNEQSKKPDSDPSTAPKDTPAKASSGSVAAIDAPANPADSKPDPSNKTTATDSTGSEKTSQKGGGILGALSSEPDKTQSSSTKKSQPSASRRRRREITGREAVDERAWLQLQLVMAKRFFVTANEDVTYIAGSTGQRSVDVLNSPNEDLIQEQTRIQRGNTTVRSRRTRFEFTAQSIRNLPGKIRSLALVDRGRLLLIGTEDGRLVARNSATLQDWDVYSRDLFAFQDQFRATTRIADEPIIAIVPFGDSQVLTATNSGLVQIWSEQDLVQPPQSPMDMTSEQVRSPVVQEKSATDVCSLQLADGRLMSCSFNADNTQCGIVTADEKITFFDVATGKVNFTLDASRFNDTQPVCLAFEGTDLLIIGLADGRVIRRALPGRPDVSGTLPDGTVTDFELLHSIDQSDRSGATTCLEFNQDQSFLYIGRFDGSVLKYDLAQKTLAWRNRKHRAAIFSIRNTENGILSLSDDRIAWLTEIPEPPPILGANTPVPNRNWPDEQQINLPEDRSLPTRVVQTESSEQGSQDVFAAARASSAATAGNRATPPLVVNDVRPADPELALLEHRLRIADWDQRTDIRGQIQRLRGIEIATDEPDYGKPSLVGEFQTQLDFTTTPFRPLNMTVSNDGTTIAAAQPIARRRSRRSMDQPVWVWDIPSQTILRTWEQVIDAERIAGLWDQGDLLPTPYSADLSLMTGSQVLDRSGSRRLFAKSKDGRVAIGHLGRPGAAEFSVSLSIPGQPIRQGVESFEGVVTALAWSADESTLFVNLREASRIRLLELDGQTLQTIHELANEPVEGTWDLNRLDVVGATHIVPGPKGRILATYGRYPQGYQLRIWKKSGSGWPTDAVQTITTDDQQIETTMTDTPFVFLNGQERSLAMIGTQGLAILETSKMKIADSLPIPMVDNRRPAAVLTPNGKHLLVGDRDGNIWKFATQNLKREPKSFKAHAAAIAGLSLSNDGSVLATAAIENRVRTWKLNDFLAR